MDKKLKASEEKRIAYILKRGFPKKGILDEPIKTLFGYHYLTNRLYEMKVFTVFDLLNLSERDLYRQRNWGDVAVLLVKLKLAKHGLTLNK